MGQPNHISGMARVFKDYTDLPATHEWNEAYLPAEAGLHFRPRRDGRLSWPRHDHGEKTLCPGPLRGGNHTYLPLRPSRLTGQLETQQVMNVELTISWAESRYADHYATDILNI